MKATNTVNLINRLMCFPDAECLHSDAMESYMKADWYEVSGQFLFLDYTTMPIEHLMDESGVEDVLTEDEISIMSIQKIDECLKRFNEVDGFYHA